MDYDDIQGVEGDYLGYEDEDFGYDEDDGDDDVGGYEYADDAGEIGDDVGDEVGRRRFRRRGPRRRRIARRRPAARMRPRMRRKKKVKYVRDDIISITATSTSAGAVTASKTITSEFRCQNASFDGSSAGAKIGSLTFHKRVVFGPFPTADEIPIAAFSGTSQKVLGLKGHRLYPSQSITLSGTIALADDTLQILIYGQEVVGGPNAC